MEYAQRVVENLPVFPDGRENTKYKIKVSNSGYPDYKIEITEAEDELPE